MPPVAASVGLAAQTDSLREVNDQLRRELKIQRQKLSECAQE